VRLLRGIRATENVALVVVVDGDTSGVATRIDELARSLRDDGQQSRSVGDRSAILVPTRSIETWFFWLCRRLPVDEAAPYKRDPEYRRAVDRGEVSAKLAAQRWSDPPSPEEKGRLPALDHGRTEIGALKDRF
jgi:hypothetical protein